MPEFVPGLQLSEAFYHEAVKPILDRYVPDLIYSAALIGWGSEVLGFDTPQSRDHHWGPRLLLFLPERNEAQWQQIDQALRSNLPYTFRGYATNFGGPDSVSVRLMQPIDAGPVNHMIEQYMFNTFCSWYLGLDPAQELDPIDWLLVPQQRLREITSGAVFHDGLNALEPLRHKLRYYPHEVWLYLLAAQWQQIAQEEAFVGRAGDVGDELGSQVVAARLVRRLMQLCFLIERQYVPYSKWFGSAFKQLACAPTLEPIFRRVFAAGDWKTREQALAEVYEYVAALHNALQVTPPLDPHVGLYYERPYRVINAERFVKAIQQAISSDDVGGLPLIGSVDQFVDSVDVLTNVSTLRKLRALYIT